MPKLKRSLYPFVIAGLIAGILWVVGFQSDWKKIEGPGILTPLPTALPRNHFNRCTGFETECQLNPSDLKLRVSFQGVSFLKPMFDVGPSDTAASGLHFHRAYFGVRKIEVEKNGAKLGVFRQALWNAISYADATDLFQLDPGTGTLYVTERCHGFLPTWTNKEGFAFSVTEAKQ